MLSHRARIMGILPMMRAEIFWREQFVRTSSLNCLGMYEICCSFGALKPYQAEHWSHSHFFTLFFFYKEEFDQKWGFPSLSGLGNVIFWYKRTQKSKPADIKSKYDYIFFNIQKENCQQVFASFANTWHSLYTRVQAPAEQTQYL